MSACTWCRGTGQAEPTALDRLDQAETGRMDLQCLACDGTGQTPPPRPRWSVVDRRTRPVNWCAKCSILSPLTHHRCIVCGSADLMPAPRYTDGDPRYAPPVVCYRCNGSGLTYDDQPDEPCDACAGTGLTRADGAPL